MYLCFLKTERRLLVHFDSYKLFLFHICLITNDNYVHKYTTSSSMYNVHCTLYIDLTILYASIIDLNGRLFEFNVKTVA